MPAPYPEEFKRHAVALVRDEGRPVIQVAKELGIAESGLRRWLQKADVEAGRRDGLTRDEKAELVELRRQNRVLKMERDLLSRAAAFFATENVHPPRR